MLTTSVLACRLAGATVAVLGVVVDAVQLVAHIVLKHRLRRKQLALNEMDVVGLRLLHFGDRVDVYTQLGER